MNDLNSIDTIIALYEYSKRAKKYKKALEEILKICSGALKIEKDFSTMRTFNAINLTFEEEQKIFRIVREALND